MGGILKVIRRGFEPLTVCLEGRCSIQLSYRTVFVDAKLRLFHHFAKIFCIFASRTL